MTSLLQQLGHVAESHCVLGDGRREYRLETLRVEVAALAGALRNSGCTRIALHADNSVEWVLADLACQQANLVCVPLPLYFSAGQIDHVLRYCGIDAVLTQYPELFRFSVREEPVPGLSLLRVADPGEPLLPAGTGKVTFTSGSTGTPKGVCLGTAPLLRQAEVLRRSVGLEAPRHLCLLPLSTLLENIAGLYAPLLAGGRVELRTPGELGFTGSGLDDPGRLLRTIGEIAPDTLILIPQLLQVLVQTVKSGWRPPDFSFIAVGGARVAATLIAEARELGLPVYEGYGLSECASVVSLNTPAHDLPGSCGRPLEHVRVSLRDGEVLVAGNAMLGYVNEAESWGRTEIATGDLGHLDAEGFLHIDGRRKNLLISSYGRNISPEWVESELLASMQFRDAVLIGDARPWCGALLYPARDTVDDAAIERAIAAVNAGLPDYARINGWLRLPRPLASLPGLLTANGRPCREAIVSHFSDEIEQLYARPVQNGCLSMECKS